MGFSSWIKKAAKSALNTVESPFKATYNAASSVAKGAWGFGKGIFQAGYNVGNAALKAVEKRINNPFGGTPLDMKMILMYGGIAVVALIILPKVLNSSAATAVAQRAPLPGAR